MDMVNDSVKREIREHVLTLFGFRTVGVRSLTATGREAWIRRVDLSLYSVPGRTHTHTESVSTWTPAKNKDREIENQYRIPAQAERWSPNAGTAPGFDPGYPAKIVVGASAYASVLMYERMMCGNRDIFVSRNHSNIVSLSINIRLGATSQQTRIIESVLF